MDESMGTKLGQLSHSDSIVNTVTSTKLNATFNVINNATHVDGPANNGTQSNTQFTLNNMDNKVVAANINHITGIDVPTYLRQINNDPQRIPKVKVNSMNLEDIDKNSFLSTSMTLGDAVDAETTLKKPRIPDGGFGWVIVFASFSISVIIDGIAFSFGLIYTELLNYFKESKTKTAWIGAFHLAVPLLAGPILSNLVDKYGCRTMTIIGGLVAGIGFVLSSISTSVEMLYLTFGLISGVGIGIGYVTAVVSIAFWFDKKRTFATSLGAAGTGIGTFIFSPFTNYLLEAYGWRGTTLILAGTLLNVCICGCLMRDPEWLIEENRLENLSQSNLTVSNSSVCLTEIRKMLETGTSGEEVLQTLVTNVGSQQQKANATGKTTMISRYCSEAVLPTYTDFDGSHFTYGHVSEAKDLDIVNQLSQDLPCTVENCTDSIANERAQRKQRHLASVETLNESEKCSNPNDSTGSFDKMFLISDTLKRHKSTQSLDERKIVQDPARCQLSVKGNSMDAILENGIAKVDDICLTVYAPFFDRFRTSEMIVNAQHPNHDHNHHHHSHNHHHHSGEPDIRLRRSYPLRNSHHFQHMRIHRKGMNYRNAMLNTHRYRLKASSCPNIYRNSMTTLAKEEEDKWYDDFIDIIKTIFDFSMFLDPKFFCFNFSTILLFIWYVVPYFSITDHLLRYNYTETDGANLISVIGVFNTIGMVILGYIGDKPWLDVPKTYAACLIVCGIATVLMPMFVYNYTYLLILAMIFGISFSSSFSFIPILLVQLTNLNDFTSAYGLVLLVQGIGSLIGPPMSGILYDYTERWDDAFYAAGFFIALAGVLAWLTGELAKRDAKTEQEK